MHVPLLDLKAQYATIKDDILCAVAEVLESQVCILGPKVAELEQNIAAISGCQFGVGVSSGTDALLCALMSLEIGPGDEVITTPFTFFASAGCISRTGATPVFVDIDPITYNIDPRLIPEAITPRTKAIMPVHLFGQMADMDPVMDIAEHHRLAVIEDAAQSITATYKNRKAGSIGTVGCLSFFPSKNLGAAGDGGMIVTNNEALYQRMSVMRSHGARPKYFHKWVGGNFRLDPIQAAILMVKVPHLDGWSAARRRNAEYYFQRLASSGVATPQIAPDRVSCINQYVIRYPRRDDLRLYLKQNKIETEIYYPLPLHLQECYAGLGYRQGAFPRAEEAAKEVLALPVYPELSTEMLDYVIGRIQEFVLEKSPGPTIQSAGTGR